MISIHCFRIEEQMASKLLEEKSTQSCDCLYDFGDFGRILMEHGANLSVTSGLRQKYSLEYHVYDQAEKYHETLHPDESWVIHWTTVESVVDNKKKSKSIFMFPDSKTISVLHVYHDKVFHRLKVVTKEGEKEVENALPTLNLKRKREQEKESAKERRLEGRIHLKSSFLEEKPGKIVYVRIGKDGKLRDLPALKEQTFAELKMLIQKEYSENETIQKGKFEVLDEEGLPVSKDTSVIGLKEKSKLQLEM